MKLSVSAYRAHSSAHKKILTSSYQSQLNYGSTAASSSSAPSQTFLTMEPIDNQSVLYTRTNDGTTNIRTCENILSPTSTSMSTSENPVSKEDEDDSSNPPSSDCKSPNQRAKPTQRWMKLRTTVQLSSAIQKKPPLKREDSFLKRFSTRQIPEAQETVEDTGSDGPHHDQEKSFKSRRRYLYKKRTVVNPDENFYFYWLMLLTFCILYNLWTLIVRQSFPELQESLSNFWFVCDCISDIAFLLDIAVQLRTGYLEQGLVVYDSKKLALHYMCSKQFLFDLVALFPLDLLQIRFGSQPLLRFPRFFKVYRSVKFYYIVESRTVWPNLWRVVNLIHILLILAHWFGCFYFLLSEAEGFQGDWVYPYRPGDYATLTRKYLGSIYWSTLTLTTIGDLPTPETNVEASDSADGPLALPRRGIKTRLLRYSSDNGYIFTIVSYLIGVFIFATIVGQVGNVITNRNANRLEFERLLDGAKTYMRHHKVPGGMKRRVLRWYDYSWSRGRIQGGGDINTALGLLPDKLKTELALHVNLSVLKKVTIFQECQPEFLHDLVLKMKAYIFTPGDSICRKGEVAREMFIIADGILEVLSETGKVLTTMKAGDFFGEIGILNLDGLNKRTADVRSVGYSELFSLSREDVLAAMKDYPEAQDILQTLGRKRLMEVRGVNKRRSKPTATAATNEDPHGHHHHHQQQSTHNDNRNQNSASSTSVKIVEKIKSDVKGIKSVLKKSKTERCGDEAHEVQHSNIINSSSNSSVSSKKNILKRMNHVKSRDLGTCDEKIEIKTNQTTTSQSSGGPIGAGLPLLQRLRLLKEKQDREEREAKLNTIKSPTHTHTHITSAVSPQESIKEETEAEIEDTTTIPFTLSSTTTATTVTASRTIQEQNIVITTTTTPITTTISSQRVQNYIGAKDLMSDGNQSNKTLSLTPTPPTSAKSEIHSHSPSSSSPTKNIISAITRKNSTPATVQKIPLKVSFRDRIFEMQNKIETQQKSETDTKKDNNIKSTKSELQEPLIPTISTKALEPSLLPLFSIKTQQNQHQLHLERQLSQPYQFQEKQIPQHQMTLKQAQTTFDSSKLWQKLKLATLMTSKSYPSLAPSTRKFDTNFLTKPNSITNIPTDRSEISFHSIIDMPISEQMGTSNIFRTGTKSKTYRSIDDLSPEYNGLPFVKKLKILNERQKIEELESIIQTRSRSLDYANISGNQLTPDSLQPLLFRSQSDAAAIYTTKQQLIQSQRQQQQQLQQEQQQQHSSPLQVPQCLCSPLSPESNETLERRQLKSILRKLNKEKTKDQFLLTEKSQIPIMSSDNMKSLLSAPTIEGYVARHTKLLKSVTVNTLPSPPISANSVRKFDNGNFFSFSPTDLLTTTSKLPPDKNGTRKIENEQSLMYKQNFPFMRDKTTDSKIEMQVSPITHEYLNELTLAIKNVIQVHMMEIQTKLQSRIATLELEVNRRDEIIDELQKRIEILEKESQESCSKCGRLNLIRRQGSENTVSSSTELLFMREDSVDTIFAVPSSSPITKPSSSNVKRRIKLKSGRRIQQPTSSSSGAGVSQRHRHRSNRIRSCSELITPENYNIENLRRPRSYQEVVISDVTGNITSVSSDNVILDIERSSTSSSTSIISNVQELTTDEDENGNGDENADGDGDGEDDKDDDDDDDEEDDDQQDDRQPSTELHCDDWEVRMLAAELDRRENSSRRSRAASESFASGFHMEPSGIMGARRSVAEDTYYLRHRHHKHQHQHQRQYHNQHHRQRQRLQEQQSLSRRHELSEGDVGSSVDRGNDDDNDDAGYDFDEQIALRPRAASLDQFNSRFKHSDNVTKAISLDRHKDRL